MENEIYFGKCLDNLLLVRGWSAARLAREINVDASYVRKWIRGERTPSLKSNYIELIADCLSMGMDLSSRESLKQDYIKIIDDMRFDIELNNNLKEIIKQALSKSQITTLKLDPEERRQKVCLRENNIVSLLERVHPYISSDKRTESIYDDECKLSDIPMIIHGRSSVLKAFISLVNGALEQGYDTDEILMTFQSEKDAFDGYKDLYDQWQNSLERVLERGWNIKHLWRLNKNVNRSFKLVEKIVDFTTYKGKYRPYYFNKYGTITPAYEIIVIPKVGALVCFATENMDYIDTAFFYHQQEAVQALIGFFNQLSVETAPLMEVFGIEEYFEICTKKDKRTGDLFVYGHDLDSLTMPYSLWEKYLNVTYNDESDIRPHLERIYNRLQQFHEQIQNYKFRYICSIEAIEHLVRTGTYYRDTKYKNPTPEDVITHLSNIILLLRTYENFEIGLMDNQLMNVLPRTCWEVKGDHTVIMEVWYTDFTRGKEDSILFMTITEGTMSSSFRQYFLELWEKITPKYRDREYIIAWLEEQIEWASNKLKTKLI